MRVFPLAIVALIGTAAACSSSSPAPLARPGSIEGDVYLVMQSGDVKRIAGNRVAILPDTSALRDALAGVCTRFEARAKPWLRAADSLTTLVGDEQAGRRRSTSPERQLRTLARSQAFVDSARTLEAPMRAAVDSVVATFVRDTAATGVNAHYTFPQVPAGKYFLHAQTMIGQNGYAWLTPVTVESGAPVKRDLDTAAEGSAGLYCGAAKRAEG